MAKKKQPPKKKPELTREARAKRAGFGQEFKDACQLVADSGVSDMSRVKDRAWRAVEARVEAWEREQQKADGIMLKVDDAKTLDLLRLLLPDIPESKGASKKVVNDWVRDRIQGGVTVKAENVPSRGALGLLIHCLASEQRRNDFLLKIWGPSSQDSDDERDADDTRRIQQLIDSALEWHREAVLATRAEGLPLELTVPESDPDLWERAAAGHPGSL